MYDTLSEIQNKRGVYLFNEAMKPFYLVEPSQVKVVILATQPISHKATPFLYTGEAGQVHAVYKGILSKQYEDLRQQRFDKFKGTNYPMIRKNSGKDSWSDTETYWRIRSKKERTLNYVGVENDPPFQTYNWFKQGVLMINTNWTGDPINWGHHNIWDTFTRTLIGRLSSQESRIVFATATPKLHAYSNLIDTSVLGGDHYMVFQENYDDFFFNINRALDDLHGPRYVINFLLDDFNKKGNLNSSNHSEGSKLRTIGF
jgi:hypothetical protein